MPFSIFVLVLSFIMIKNLIYSSKESIEIFSLCDLIKEYIPSRETLKYSTKLIGLIKYY